jgi:putative addiction module component (TIGR02574 family)
MLIEDLDASIDVDSEQMWIDEAQRRYEAFRAGRVETRPGEEVMARARRRLE